MFARSLRGQRTPRQGRIRLLVAFCVLLVMLVLGEVIDQVVNSYPSAQRRVNASWTAALRPILQGSSELGGTLSRLEGSTRSTDPAQFDALVTSLVQLSGAAVHAYGDLGIPAPTRTAGQLATNLLAKRSAAASELDLAVALARGPGHDVASSITDCRIGANDVSAADADQASLRRVLRKVPGASLELPSPWRTSAPGFRPSACPTFVRQLASNASLQLRATLKVLDISVITAQHLSPVRIVGVPNPTTTTVAATASSGASGLAAGGPTGPSGLVVVVGPSGIYIPSTTLSPRPTTTTAVTTTTLQIPPKTARSYLPPTGSISVEVVVANTGDVAVSDVALSVQLVGNLTEPSPMAKHTVARIAAAGAAYYQSPQLSLRGIKGAFDVEVHAEAAGVPTADASVTLVTSG